MLDSVGHRQCRWNRNGKDGLTMISFTISMTDAIFGGAVYIIAVGLTWFAVTDLYCLFRR